MSEKRTVVKEIGPGHIKIEATYHQGGDLNWIVLSQRGETVLILPKYLRPLIDALSGHEAGS